jgi:hypothetical protein
VIVLKLSIANDMSTPSPSSSLSLSGTDFNMAGAEYWRQWNNYCNYKVLRDNAPNWFQLHTAPATKNDPHDEFVERQLREWREASEPWSLIQERREWSANHLASMVTALKHAGMTDDRMFRVEIVKSLRPKITSMHDTSLPTNQQKSPSLIVSFSENVGRNASQFNSGPNRDNRNDRPDDSRH